MLMEPTLQRLAGLQPKTLVTMHGSAFVGDGARALRDLATMFKDVLGPKRENLKVSTTIRDWFARGLEGRSMFLPHAQVCADLTRIIHETLLLQSPIRCYDEPPVDGLALRTLTVRTSTHRVLGTPRAGLATRLSDFATNRHE